jgi:predicted short-subunit dehydrogenase-like oxidoreductase (DUF2520 family)
MNKPYSFAVIGPGRLGKTIITLLKYLGYQLDTVIKHTSQEDLELNLLTQNLHSVNVFDNNTKKQFNVPDIVFITTPDDLIELTAKNLTSYKNWKEKIVFHCSGALSSKALSALAEQGAFVGSLHPLKSFSTPIKSIDELAEVYWCIEGHEKAVNLANDIVLTAKGKVVTIEADKKTLYHAAAVMSCGHLIALLDLSLRLLGECQIPESQAKEMLLPLIQSTIRNFASKSSDLALTGPFARGDEQTINNHLQALMKVPNNFLSVYLLLGQHSLEIKNKNRSI